MKTVTIPVSNVRCATCGYPYQADVSDNGDVYIYCQGGADHAKITPRDAVKVDNWLKHVGYV